jgi:hypothetical protein
VAVTKDAVPGKTPKSASSPYNQAMKDPRTLLAEFRSRVVIAPELPAREDWLNRLDSLTKALDNQAAKIARLRQDVEEAEHTRDAANLARMRVFGQLNTLHKTLAAATPGFEGDEHGEVQHVALRRIEWLVSRGGSDPGAVLAAKKAEMEAPMPGQAVLEAVIAGERRFTKAQMEFSVSEAMVLTNWELTPLEIMEKGEPWLAELILKSHSTPAE